MNTWDLRAEILRITHRWYLILVFMLVGAALGWGAASLWPAPYRATMELYVGLNAYRAPYDRYVAHLAGQSFNNVDDYKHWQMAQLNEFILTDPVLEATLARLETQDPAWSRVTPDQFRKAARVLWQNAGRWQLVVQMPDRQQALQAVETWAEVALEEVNQAVAHAREVVALDIRMSDLSETRVELSLHQQVLVFVRGQLLAWIDRLDALPQAEGISSTDHLEILGLVSQAATWEPLWDQLLEEAPPPGSAPADYHLWLERALLNIEFELQTLPAQIASINEAYASLEPDYKSATVMSKGLASTLVVEQLTDEPAALSRARFPGTASLVGGLLGLLVWAWVEGVNISRKSAS